MYEDFSFTDWLTTTNHKRIGILYIVTAVFFLIVGGGLAELIRVQLGSPNGTLLTPSTYSQAVSLHGLIMILWFISPFAVGLANYFVPMQIGAKDVAFPRLNSMSYWMYLFSGLLLVSTVFLPGGGPSAGWTFYAPLNTAKYTPQPGMTLAILAIALLAVSVTASSVNFLTTIFKMRAKGVTWSKMPIFTWSILFTIVLMLFAFPPLAAGLVMVTSDRVLGTVFFASYAGGSLLWAQLFWFFGHPEVYIVALPALGIIAEVFSTFSKRPLFGKKLLIVELTAVTILSVGVWMHHMFTTGVNFDTLQAFSITTLAISVPFEGVVINLVLTLRKGATRLTTPLLFCMGAIFFVILGGITGVFQAYPALDYFFHGSYWIVGHFHYVMVGTTIFALLAAMYYWFPKMTHKMYNETFGKFTFLVSFIGFNVLYLPYFLLTDMPRRIASYATSPGWEPFNLTATIGALVFGPAVLLTFINLYFSYRKKKTVENNPWGAKSAEWTGNYEGNTSIHSLISSVDWPTVQSETPISTPQIESYFELEKKTYLPVIIALGSAVLIAGFVLFWPVALVGLAIIAEAILKWFHDGIHDKYAQIKENLQESWPFESFSKEKFGVWIFLVSEIVIFGSFIASYVYTRTNSSIWPNAAQVHNLTIGTTNTLILVTSSLAMVLALQAIKNDSQRGLIAGLVAAFSLGVTFEILKLGIEWPQEIANGFIITGGIAQSTYYVLMGAHALHVAVGLIAISYLLVKSYAGRFTSQSHSSVELVGLYWTFVDIVWLFLFALFYLI